MIDPEEKVLGYFIGIDPGPELCHCVSMRRLSHGRWELADLCSWNPRESETPLLGWLGVLTTVAVEDFVPGGHVSAEGLETAKNIGRIDALLRDTYRVELISRARVAKHFDLKSVATITKYQARGADALINAILRERMTSVPKGSHYRSAAAVAITCAETLS